jgi:hypothetical protein
MPDITLALALLKKPVEAVGAIATGKAKEVIARVRATGSLKSLYQKLNATQKVKTIWNVDRALALSSFYFPAKIKTRTGVIQPLSKLDDLPSNAVVLSGTVGQGKSILLRYLLGKEIRSGIRVPLFIELRRAPVDGLENYLRKEFAALLDVHGHPEVFDLFATSGRVSLLLDGFDEVDPDRVPELVASIDKLASDFPEARIVVTSRPSSGIETSPHFDIIPIAQLTDDDFSGFFHKILSKDKALAERITTAVLKSPTQVKKLASTPLLATLLTIVYRAKQRIPSDFSEFYEELFQILLVRHDRSKSGWERKRKTRLSDREIQQVFEAYCYKLKSEGASSVPRSKALEVGAASLAALKISADEGYFIADIVKVTCLLQEEGGRVEFLHQSVQEFFAARYLLSRPDDVARAFYGLVHSERKWATWDQVLRFLSQIDKYRSSLYFYIPALQDTLTFLESLNSIASGPRLRALVTDHVGIRQSLLKGDGTPEDSAKFGTLAFERQPYFGLTTLHSQVFETFFRQNATKGKWHECFDGKTHNQRVSYTKIAAHCEISDTLDACLVAGVEALRTELEGFKAQIEVLDDSRAFMGL